MVLNFHNIKQMLQNNELSWASLESTLKESHTDDETIKKVQSLFNMIDANRSRTISLQEWENVYGILNNMDSDGNGEISDEEFNNAQEDNMFKQFGNKALNTFLNTAVQMDKNASNPLAASISGGGGQFFSA